jgi:hypothetical protein
MKRAATVLGVTAAVTSIAAGGALAATATKYDVMVSGKFTTKAAATKEIGKLSAKKLTGFKAVKSGKTYKVERAFTSKSKANTELSKLKKDGFKGKVAKA